MKTILSCNTKDKPAHSHTPFYKIYGGSIRRVLPSAQQEEEEEVLKYKLNINWVGERLFLE